MPDVYCIINKVNRKKYIGICKDSYKRRLRVHIWNSKNKKRPDVYEYPLYKAMRKYSIDEFEIQLLETVDSWEKAKEREKYYISLYRTFTEYSDCNGYNQTLGGEGTLGRAGELHAMYGKRGKKSPNYGKKRSDETKKILSEGKIGELNPMYGKCGNLHHNYGKEVSVEMREHLRRLNKGKIIPLETRLKISKTMTGKEGRPHTEETKRKLSEIAKARVGILAPNYGKKFTNEHRKKLSEAKRGKYVGELNPSYGKKGKLAARSKKIVQLDLKYNLINTWESMGLAFEATGVTSSAISKVCRGDRNKAGGFIWMFYKDYLKFINENISLNNKNISKNK